MIKRKNYKKETIKTSVKNLVIQNLKKEIKTVIIDIAYFLRKIKKQEFISALIDINVFTLCALGKKRTKAIHV